MPSSGRGLQTAPSIHPTHANSLSNTLLVLSFHSFLVLPWHHFSKCFPPPPPKKNCCLHVKPTKVLSSIVVTVLDSVPHYVKS